MILSNKARVLYTLILTLTFSTVRADCTPCWELRRVQIFLKNGDLKTGFVKWNEGWVSEWLGASKGWENKFPESLLEIHRSRPTLRGIKILTKLWTVKNDSLFEFKAITNEDEFEVQVNDIKKIVEIDKTLKKHQGTGDIPVYTKAEIDTLNTNPYATYLLDNGVSETYFISYDSGTMRKDLEQISKTKYWDNKDGLTKMGVIVVTLYYD